jgi:hypothetical protein
LVAADPTRRRVLAAAGLAALTAAGTLGTAGCAAGQPWPWATPPKPAPDVGVLRDAITAEDAMISRYTGVIAAFPALAGSISPLLTQHREHLAQLRARLVIPPGPGPSASPTATARTRPRGPRIPSSEHGAVAFLRAAERDEAAALTGWLTGVTPSLAQLLASIAASEATHAALLGDGPPAAGSLG